MNEELNRVYASLRKALEQRWACNTADMSDQDILDAVLEELAEECQDVITQRINSYYQGTRTWQVKQ